MKKDLTCSLFAVTSLFLLLPPKTSFALDPNQKALELSQNAKQPVNILSTLTQMVRKMGPSQDGLVTRKLLDDTLSLLGAAGYPKFDFLLGKNQDQKQIIEKLLKELPSEKNGKKSYVASEWAIGGDGPLFPKRQPMPILAAAGAAWKSHHSYPGGLVYHLYTTAQTNKTLLETYEKAYRFKFKQSEKDLVVLSGIWHDAAKAWTIAWKENGTVTANEGQIAWTGSHHVLSAAEALVRGYPKEFVMTIAASHDPALESDNRFQSVLNYLAATAIVADRKMEDVGLEKDGSGYKLLQAPSVFMFIQNLGDGDWVLTEQAIRKARPKLEEIVTHLYERQSTSIPLDNSWKNWLVNKILTKHGEIALYHLWEREGDEGLSRIAANQFQQEIGSLFQMRPAGISFSTPRQMFAVTPLDSSHWLITGGHLKKDPDAEISDSADLLETLPGNKYRLRALPAAMRQKRWGHQATRLPNGDVFICGGSPSVECERYSTKENRFIDAGHLSQARAGHALFHADGKIFIVGGLTPESVLIEAFDENRLEFIDAGMHLPYSLKDFQFYQARDVVYLFGGTSTDRNSVDRVLKVDFKSKAVAEMPGRLIDAREDISVCPSATGNQVLAFGGEIKGHGVANGKHSGKAEVVTLEPFSIAPAGFEIYRDDAHVILADDGSCLVLGGTDQDENMQRAVMKISVL